MKRTLVALVALAALTACSNAPQPTVRNFANPMPGIYTSGQPTPEQFAGLKNLGITRVIHLRLATEKGTGWEEEQADQFGLEFVRLPIPGANGLTRENVESLAAELKKGTEAGTLVSCGSSNRVGAMFALKAHWLDGAAPENALTIGRAAGLKSLESEVRDRMK